MTDVLMDAVAVGVKVYARFRSAPSVVSSSIAILCDPVVDRRVLLRSRHGDFEALLDGYYPAKTSQVLSPWFVVHVHACVLLAP
jgi:hypothetical protein